jgi:PAS domain S-box-containing protein
LALRGSGISLIGTTLMRDLTTTSYYNGKVAVSPKPAQQPDSAREDVFPLTQDDSSSETLDSHRGEITGSTLPFDVTDPRRALEIQRHLAAIIESSDDAIVSKDLNGIVQSWNKAAERIFGYTAEEIVGKSILTIIPGEFHSEEPRILATLAAGGKIDHYETQRLRKDGSRVWVSLTISPIRNQQGQVIGASKIARDITERQRVQEVLIQSEKLAVAGRMAASLAHEVNNPLEAITNLAYLLSTDETVGDKCHDYAQLILQEVGRASEFTKKSLSFYRERNQPSRFDVCELVDGVLDVYEPKLSKNGIQLLRIYKCRRDVFGYASEIRQIVANLISNAAEAVKENGCIYVRVTTAATLRSGPAVWITVADNGPGIDKQHREQLFQAFFTTKGPQGSGLGLWVSQAIAKKHKGKIKVRSRTEQDASGAVFSLLLPVG